MTTLERGVSDVAIDLPSRVDLVADRWSKRSPDRVALVEGGDAWTYGHLASAVAESRTWLLEQGIRPGDRVMIISENCRAVVALYLAICGLNSWPVVVNARLSDREVDQVRSHCGARRVLYAPATSALARAHAERHSAAMHCLAALGPIAIGPIDRGTVPEPLTADDADQVAALVYTSGTTGRPKGVMLTHRNILFVARTSGKLRALRPEDRVLGALPSSHSLGLSVVLLGTLFHGATLYLYSRFDPAQALIALEQERLSVMIGTPVMFSILVEYARRKQLRSITHSLRVVSTAGAPLDPVLKSATEQLLGLPLHNGYGVTECSPTIAQTRLEWPRNDCSVGPVWPGVEAKLVPVEGTPSDEVGELWVRGPNVMKGYYGAPDDTASAIDREGWFNTRDLARFDRERHLFIVGRTRELIIRFGYNVYPAEIEAILNAHPAVARSAVVGRSIAGSEEIVAFVQPVSTAYPTAAELGQYAAGQLASYKRPSHFLFVEAIPTNLAGKILKSELVTLAEARLSQGR
jgi:long-chain acyl-CoA synthetase